MMTTTTLAEYPNLLTGADKLMVAATTTTTTTTTTTEWRQQQQQLNGDNNDGEEGGTTIASPIDGNDDLITHRSLLLFCFPGATTMIIFLANHSKQRYIYYSPSLHRGICVEIAKILFSNLMLRLEVFEPRTQNVA
jgi:hypothetical protein